MLRSLAIFFSLASPLFLCAQKNLSDKDKKKIKDPAHFKVIKIGEPVVYFGKYGHGTEVLKNNLIKTDSVQIKHCFNLPSEYKVVRYRFSFYADNQYYSFTVRSCTLTAEIKNVLQKAKNGTKIKISGVVGVRREKKDTVRKDFDAIVIKVLEKPDTNLITYKLKNALPEPDIFSIKELLPAKVTRLELMFVDRLYVKCDCKIPSYSTKFNVVEFDLKKTLGGDKMIYSTKGAMLTGEMRHALEHAKSGTKFSFENIKVRTEDGLMGYLKPRMYKVIP